MNLFYDSLILSYQLDCLKLQVEDEIQCFPRLSTSQNLWARHFHEVPLGRLLEPKHLG